MSYNTSEIIKASLENVEALNKKLNDIETLHSQIKESIAESAKIPGFFKKLGVDLNHSTENYLEGNNTVFKENSLQFEKLSIDLDIEIQRLKAITFEEHLDDLSKVFITTTREALSKEYEKLDEKASKFQTLVNELKQEISRLAKIDMEAHFEKHQNKLSEIFNAVNNINGTLTTLLQNTIKITQGIGDLETDLKNYHNDFKQKIKSFESELANQKEFLTNEFKKTDTAFENLNAQNNEIKAEMATIAKKQQTNTYITWGLIVLAVIVLILIRK